MPILILAILALSIIPATMPVMAALSTPTLENTEAPFVGLAKGDYGDTVIVTGKDGEIPAGSDIILYWDGLVAWDGEKGVLNATAKALPSGNYEVWFEVPEAVAGSHYVWIYSDALDDQESAEFEVVPLIKLSQSSGLEDERVTVKGHGFGDEADADIFFEEEIAGGFFETGGDGAATWTDTQLHIGDGSAKLTSSGGPQDEWTNYARVAVPGGNIKFSTVTSPSYWFRYLGPDVFAFPYLILALADVPSGAPSAWIVLDVPNAGWSPPEGVWTQWDLSKLDAWHAAKPDVPYFKTGTLATLKNDAEFMNMYVVAAKVAIGEWSVGHGPTTAYIDDIEISGITYHLEPPIKETGADELGSFETSFRVPEGSDGAYKVTAYDEKGNRDWADFRVGACISLDLDEGPSGTVVTIDGRGFIDAEAVVIDNIAVCGVTWVGTGIAIMPVPDAGGEFEYEVVIPTVKAGDHDIVVEYSGGISGTVDASFEVTGTTAIELTPEYGSPGDKMTMEGFNFTHIEGTKVKLSILGTDYTNWKTFETNRYGEFSESVSIPTLDDDDYIYSLEDEYGLKATDEFRIGFMVVIISPDEVATGELVTIMGRGFKKGGDWNATLDDDTFLVEGDVDPDDGTLMETFTMPTVPVGEYEVIVWDMDAEIKIIEDMEITDTTTVTLDPSSAPVTYNVTVEGRFFSQDDSDIEWVIYNVTAAGEVDEDWDLGVLARKGVEEPLEPWKYKAIAVTTTDEGNFTAWFEVPDDLGLGEYLINATDDNNLFYQATFAVTKSKLYVSVRKDSYRIGEAVGFDIRSSFPDEYTIEIYDPADTLYWSVELGADDYTKVGTLHVIPLGFWTTTTLPTDAPMGTWDWTVLDEDGDEVESGSFTVTAAPEVILEGQIAELSEEIAGLSGDLGVLSEDFEGVKTDISGLKTDIDGVTAGIGDAVDEAMEGVDTKIGGLEDKIGGIEEKVGETDTKVGGLSGLVYAAIGAAIVAALAAIASLLQISRRIAG